jgi:hypothetical protein
VYRGAHRGHSTFPRGWAFDLNQQVDDWPMAETFGRAEVVRGFRGIGTFIMTEFWSHSVNLSRKIG